MGNGLSLAPHQCSLGARDAAGLCAALESGKIALVGACTNPDLLWALRGGDGCSCGIVTSRHAASFIHLLQLRGGGG